MSKVFVVDTYEHPLDPVHPGRARILLKEGKAAVWRRFPFTLILRAAVNEPVTQPLRLKLDPGSKTTGMAIVNDTSGDVVFAAEVMHRGHLITKALADRRAIRRSRRARKTRYRKPRWQNRRRPQGWLPPSLESRIANIQTWVARLARVAPVTAISMELVKFDQHLMEHAAISGVEYQQGTLQGYEVRAYVMEKWNHRCAYCGKHAVPFEVDHVVPRAKGGSNRVSNLVLACKPCNDAKGTQDLAVFLKKQPEVLTRIEAQLKAPLKHAAAMNATRWAVWERLKATSVPIECGSGGLTAWNRTRRGLPKTHWLDAANVGKSTPEVLHTEGVVPLLITATGHGRRQMSVPNKYGFPGTAKERRKTFLGYRTGDIVKAVTPQGTLQGRIAIRHRPSFRLGKRDIHPKYLRRVHRADGYGYEKGVLVAPPDASSQGFPQPAII